MNMEEKYIDVGIPFSYWDKEVEVVCPRCHSTALVHSTSTQAKCVCSHCGKIEQKNLGQPQYAFLERRTGQLEVDPFFGFKLALIEQTSSGNIWVYNADQLNHLKSYVSAKLREKKEMDKYFDYYISYFHKLPAWIKSSKHRVAILKKITALEKKTITKPNNKTPLDIANDIKESFFYRWNWSNRSWKFLDQSNFFKGDYSTAYYPNIQKKSITILSIKNSKLLLSEALIENGTISVEQKLIRELPLRNTTKKSTFRHTIKGKPPIYYSINIRKLSGESFTVKELLVDVANMDIDSTATAYNHTINFEADDYIFKFVESHSPHPDFAPTEKDKTQTSYGFSKSAMKKILNSIRDNT